MGIFSKLFGSDNKIKGNQKKPKNLSDLKNETEK